MSLKYIYFNNIAEHVDLFQECINILRNTNPSAIGNGNRIGIADLIVYDTNNNSNVMPYALYLSCDPTTYQLTQIEIDIQDNFYSIIYNVNANYWYASDAVIGDPTQYTRMVCDVDNINTWVETMQHAYMYIYDRYYNFYRYRFSVIDSLRDQFVNIANVLSESIGNVLAGENTLKIANTGNFGNALAKLNEISEYFINENLYFDSTYNECEIILMSTNLLYSDTSNSVYNRHNNNLLAYVKDNDTNKEIQCYSISRTSSAIGLSETIRYMLQDMVHGYYDTIKYFYFITPYSTVVDINGTTHNINITPDLLNKWLMISAESDYFYNNVIKIKEVPYSPDLLIISDCNNTEYIANSYHPEFVKNVPVSKYGQIWYNHIYSYIPNIHADSESEIATVANALFNKYVELYNILGDMPNISSDDSGGNDDNTPPPVDTNTTGKAKKLLNDIAKKILHAEGNTEAKIRGNEILDRLDGVLSGSTPNNPSAPNTNVINVLDYECNQNMDTEYYYLYELEKGSQYEITIDINAIIESYPEIAAIFNQNNADSAYFGINIGVTDPLNHTGHQSNTLLDHYIITSYSCELQTMLYYDQSQPPLHSYNPISYNLPYAYIDGISWNYIILFDDASKYMTLYYERTYDKLKLYINTPLEARLEGSAYDYNTSTTIYHNATCSFNSMIISMLNVRIRNGSSGESNYADYNINLSECKCIKIEKVGDQ